MGLIYLQYEDGQTPIDEDEKEGLLVASVNTIGELNEVEQRNIEQAIRWTLERRKKFTAGEILTESFVRSLHKRMLGEVWKWAGLFRNSNKNIGVDKYIIGTELQVLLDDCKYWILNKTFTDEEIVIRFKHRLVNIYCFANGNGRHSRLMADLIIEKVFSKEVFTWGSKSLVSTGNERSNYMMALRGADNNDFDLLMKFARS